MLQQDSLVASSLAQKMSKGEDRDFLAGQVHLKIEFLCGIGFAAKKEREVLATKLVKTHLISALGCLCRLESNSCGSWSS